MENQSGTARMDKGADQAYPVDKQEIEKKA